MKILLIHEFQKNGESVTYNAVNYYRMQKPLEVLKRHHGVDYSTADTHNVPDNILQEFDLVLFSRVIRDAEKTAARLNKLGIPFGLDLDDYWYLDEDHLLIRHYHENKVSEKIIASIKVARFVTCTTDILANYIKELNPNVYVLPNGIDTEDEYWKPEKVKSDRLRFGFTQGETHLADIMSISSDVARSFNDTKFYHKAQVILAGFRVHEEVIKSATRTRVVKGSVQIGYESILTDDLRALKFEGEYVHKLKTLQQVDGTNKPYRRLPSTSVGEFGGVYDHLDISVVPLRSNPFCSCKSNIKMLEAGFKDCGVIVSHVAPYIPLATKKNSYSLNEKNFYEWQRFILNNPNDLEDRKARLLEDVQPYSLKNLSKERLQVYESCKRVCV